MTPESHICFNREAAKKGFKLLSPFVIMDHLHPDLLHAPACMHIHAQMRARMHTHRAAFSTITSHHMFQLKLAWSLPRAT